MAVNFIEAGIEVFFLKNSLPSKKWTLKKKIIISALTVIFKALFTFGVAQSSFLMNFEFILIIAAIFLMAEVNCDGFHFEKLSVAIICSGISTVSSLLTSILIPVILQKDLADILANNGSFERIFALSFAKLSQFVLCMLVSLIIRRINVEADEKVWSIAAILMFCSFICSDMAMSIMLTENEKIKDLLLVLLVPGLFTMNIIVFGMFLRVLKERDSEYKLMKSIDLGYAEIKNIKEQETVNDNFRSMIHEIRNEYIPISQLLKENKTDKAIAKLDELIGESETFIENEYFDETDMPFVDAVLRYYKKHSYEKKIDFTIRAAKFKLEKSKEKIVCSILINMLKNAYEACEKSNNKNNVIVELFVIKDYVRIAVKNSIKESILDSNKELLTTKNEKLRHGYGIKTIHRLAIQNGGNNRYYELDGFFVNEAWIFSVGGRRIDK